MNKNILDLLLALIIYDCLLFFELEMNLQNLILLFEIIFLVLLNLFYQNLNYLLYLYIPHFEIILFSFLPLRYLAGRLGRILKETRIETIKPMEAKVSTTPTILGML